MSRQAEFARKSFEAALKNASEVAEMVRTSPARNPSKFCASAFDEATNEIREGYEKKQIAARMMPADRA